MTIGSTKPGFNPVGVILAAGLLLLLAVGVGAWWLGQADFSFGGENTIEGVVAQKRSWGHWAALGSIILMVVHSFLPFPSEIVASKNLSGAFRALPIPVIGRIEDGRFILDLRCLEDESTFAAQVSSLQPHASAAG